MNELKVFNNAEFGQVRTVEIYDKTYFVANDVAKALGYSVPKDAVSRHCKGALIRRYLTEGGEQDLKVIPEGDVYRLVIKSQLPSAAKFESWIFDEVLPSIRQNGGYIANQEDLTPEQIVANALVVARNILAKKDKVIAEMQPKAEFFDAVADSKTAVSMNEVAKVLNFKDMGRNRLFQFLRDNDVLDKRNVPYQRYVDAGWFRVIEQSYQRNNEPVVTTKTLVYQKGVDGIRKLLLREGYTNE